MTTIDSAPRLAAVLRQQVAAFRPAATRRSPAAATDSSQAPADIAAVVARRIHALGFDDPQRKPKAVRIFLESVLLQELGLALANDPAFPAMVDAVQQQMQSDARLAAAVDELGDRLVAP
jgi:hypothetical protein